MPRIILARTSGFCMGVKRAMQMALQTAAKAPGRVFTSGPLIHNPQAVEYLRENGVGTVKDWHTVTDGTIIIRAHGMPAGQIREISERGLAIVDATCPHVVTSQRQIKKYSEKGYYIYIIGDPDHPEILSLQSFATAQEVIAGEEQARRVPRRPKVMVIGQTTFNEDEFNRIAAILKASADEAVICDSICQATSDRQQEIRKLAAEADAVVIVGGKSSANTRRLAEIAAGLCPRTFHVETEAELNLGDFAGCQNIIVSAGASTPDFITQKVIDFLATLDRA
ncbi:MAG TPA: 4-hydroxy-3-methylbut-2-enyl diphosphate reductase [Candidatus Rifleibacterium sp.]|jgi:4-hydroxy-3-methylbut-2-enyl diphosphate reductase|nr:4-hydroxy-3-methylbut-2-enyl diphosphate reductase [Candidatus Rifleibacterium sp.]